jgi:4-amino-4-deoxy-L-arabinose transferase-like glycosyltransferase
LLPSFVALSLISGKQVHYLLPLFPAVALLAAHGLERLEAPCYSLRMPGLILALFSLLVLSLPWWRVLPDWADELQAGWALLLLVAGFFFWRCRPLGRRAAIRWLALSSVLLVMVLHLVMQGPLHRAYDLRPVAREIARLQQSGVPLIHESKYAGEYHFLGRLRQPLEVINKRHLENWSRQHPHGYIVYYYSRWEKDLLPDDCHFSQHYRGGYVAVIPAHLFLDQLTVAP